MGSRIKSKDSNSLQSNFLNIGSLGAGQDGQALIWDNATSRFVMASVSSPSIYTGSGTVPTSVVATLTDTLTFQGNGGLILNNSTINNNTALISLSKAMSNNSNRSTYIEGVEDDGGVGSNYWKIYNQGSLNFNYDIGIGFYSNDLATTGTEYTRKGIKSVGNNEFYVEAGEVGINHFQLRSGGSNVTDNGYLKFIDYNGASTRIQFQRSGLNYINPDSRTGGNGSVVLMGDSLVGSELISLQGSTLVSDKFEIQTTTAGFLMPRMTTAQMNAIAAPDTHLLIFNTDLNGIYRYNGSAWVALSTGYGIISINDSSGQPTFYASLTAAMAAASSGDTVFLHSDITETSATTVTIPSGVNFNLNGFTYTLDGQGINAIVYSGTNTKTSITNGKIVHSNSSSLGSALYIGGSPDLVDCTGLTVIGDGLRCLRFNVITAAIEKSVLVGGSFIYNGVGTNDVQYVLGTAKGSFFNPSDGYVYGVGLEDCYIKGGIIGGGATIITNCRVENDSAYPGIYINGSNNWTAVISNTYVFSENSDAIEVINKVTITNCFTESSGGHGINALNSELKNCFGKSSNTYGILLAGLSGKATDCAGESSVTAGFCTGGDAILVRCSGVSTLNTSSGHGFYNQGSGDPIMIDCFAKVVNTSAYAIQGSQATDAKIVRLSGKGMTTLIGTNITNTQINTSDAYGNIIIG